MCTNTGSPLYPNIFLIQAMQMKLVMLLLHGSLNFDGNCSLMATGKSIIVFESLKGAARHCSSLEVFHTHRVNSL